MCLGGDSMNRLKDVRIATGKKQYVVAEDLGTSQQVLSRYERGETEPDFETLRRQKTQDIVVF